MKLFSHYFMLNLNVVLLIAVFAANVYAGPLTEKLILVGSHGTKNSFHGKWLALIYADISQRLGYELQYDSYPSARASVVSDSGKVHGEINRVSMYQAKHPNLVRIEESHFSSTISAYALKQNIVIDNWQSLKNKNYKIIYRRGTRIIQRSLAGLLPETDISAVTDIEQGIKKLLRGRDDVYIGVQDTVDEKLSAMILQNPMYLQIHKVGILVETNLHAYIHHKYLPLVDEITRLLKQLKQEGIVEQYRQMALQQSPLITQ